MSHVSFSSMNTFIHTYMCVVFMGAGYFLKHSQNTQMLCYAKQYCFPNKLYFMTEPAEQGLDRVSLSESNEPWSLFLSPVHSVSSTGPLKTHLVFFDTTNTTNTADPNPEPRLEDDGKSKSRTSASESLSLINHVWNQHFRPLFLFFFNLKYSYMELFTIVLLPLSFSGFLWITQLRSKFFLK